LININMRADEFTTSKIGVHPLKNRPNYIVGEEIEKTAAFGKKTLFVNIASEPKIIEELITKYKCKHIYFEVSYAISNNKNKKKILKDFRKLAQYFLKKGILVTIDIPNELANTYADLTDNKNFILNVAIHFPKMHKLKDNVSIKFVDTEYKGGSGGVYVADLDSIRDTKNNFTPWEDYSADVKVIVNPK